MASSKTSATGWALIRPQDWNALFTQLDDINHRLDVLTFRGEANMATVNEVLARILAKTTEADGRVASLAAFTDSLKKELLDALGGTLTPAQEATVNQIFGTVQGSEDKIDAALVQPAP